LLSSQKESKKGGEQLYFLAPEEIKKNQIRRKMKTPNEVNNNDKLGAPRTHRSLPKEGR
jgi:hypothetical protein